MKLKETLDLERFFAAVRQCRGQVTFETPEGDVLNLKSSLCLFVFTAASQKGFVHLPGRVRCHDPEDEPLLAEFAEVTE